MKNENRLSELRGNMSQKEMSALLGLSQQTYSNYESGKTDLPSNVVKEACRVFCVSAEWLLMMDEIREENELLAAFAALDKTGRAILLEQARAMVDSGRYRKGKNTDDRKEAV